MPDEEKISVIKIFPIFLKNFTCLTSRRISLHNARCFLKLTNSLQVISDFTLDKLL